ncbi:Flagellar hook-associated protein 3 [uncultured Sporomusa sp.]|uniref:Flagellar hook-associated protein 3 n=1 Tax=uncultured Sporomusa sp. TaxID=307249 RepID=A0A212M1K4_9FIRM|nr:flagellar hook-associated protein FlgL [uncultured Sporomusa sp.]SCM83655.1 Flagellar hook-associated protein 3 [uncultured Sporomusa sp.]
MRVSTNMLSFNFMISLNKNLGRQNKIQQQLSDGKALHRPSDDPVKTIRSLRFNINLKENEQYTQHVKDSISWMETTDGAMSDLSSLTIRAKELVVKSVSVNPDMALDAIANELDGIINQMIEIGNTKIGDRYVFAGQNDKIQPFQRRTVTAADGTQTEAVVYSGDTNKISMRIQPGSVTPSQDSVNLTGEDVFGFHTITENGKEIQTAQVLNDLIKVKEALKGQTSAKSNPAGGDISQTSADAHNAFTLRIEEVDGAGLPTKVSYSIDGGVTWESSGGIPPNPKIAIDGTGKVTITDTDGLGTATVEYQLTAAAANKTGDTYTLPHTASDRDLQWLSKSGLYLVDNAHSHILQAQTEMGARMAMYIQAQALLEKNNVVITEDVSANEDLDIAKAIIDFKTSESIYRAALSVGAKLMPPSLVDFMS